MIKSTALKKKIEILCDKDFSSFTIDDLNSIKSINLSNADVANNVTPIYFEDLLNLKNLESLTIRNANITIEDYAYILRLKNLKTLTFYDCSIEDLVNIYSLEKLEDIKLINSYAGSIQNIGNIKNLKSVSLINHELDDLNFLDSLNLDSLIISNTTIDNYDNIYNFKTIKLLKINNTNIDNLDFLIEFKDLKELCIDNNQLNNNMKIVNYLKDKGVLVYDEFTNIIGEEYV